MNYNSSSTVSSTNIIPPEQRWLYVIIAQKVEATIKKIQEHAAMAGVRPDELRKSFDNVGTSASKMDKLLSAKQSRESDNTITPEQKNHSSKFFDNLLYLQALWDAKPVVANNIIKHDMPDAQKNKMLRGVVERLVDNARVSPLPYYRRSLNGDTRIEEKRDANMQRMFVNTRLR